MEKLSRQAIAELLKQTKGPLVTMYIPMITSASPPHMSENQLRLKNTFTKAIQTLKKEHGSGSLASQLREQLDKALNDYHFWEDQTEGLLVCASPNAIRMFHLPIDTEAYVAIDDIYHLAPVLALVHDAVSYYVLSIAQHEPKLFSGDMYDLTEVSLGLPHDIKQALHLDEANPRGEQSRSASGSQTSSTSFNGRGSGRDPRDDMRVQFFRHIDHLICNATDTTLPLILAGTDSEIAEYRSISKYPHLLGQAITGSLSGVKTHDVKDKALRIIQHNLIAARHDEAIQSFQQLQGTQPKLTATDSRAISAATEQGQVGTLLINFSRTTADTVRETTKQVQRLTFPRPHISKLINKVAHFVEKGSGTIVNVESPLLSKDAAMAAILRY
jgi:hypothetical protein